MQWTDVTGLLTCGVGFRWLPLDSSPQDAGPDVAFFIAVQKGVRHLLPERPFGCFAQKVPDPFLNRQMLPDPPALSKGLPNKPSKDRAEDLLGVTRRQGGAIGQT
jgi:hypothetical protein